MAPPGRGDARPHLPRHPGAVRSVVPVVRLNLGRVKDVGGLAFEPPCGRLRVLVGDLKAFEVFATKGGCAGPGGGGGGRRVGRRGAGGMGRAQAMPCRQPPFPPLRSPKQLRERLRLPSRAHVTLPPSHRAPVVPGCGLLCLRVINPAGAMRQGGGMASAVARAVAWAVDREILETGACTPQSAGQRQHRGSPSCPESPHLPRLSFQGTLLLLALIPVLWLHVIRVWHLPGRPQRRVKCGLVRQTAGRFLLAVDQHAVAAGGAGRGGAGRGGAGRGGGGLGGWGLCARSNVMPAVKLAAAFPSPLRSCGRKRVGS
jgi:hypothetical protein